MLANAMKTAVMKLLFQNVGAANIGDATGLPASATAGSFYCGLHTATIVASNSAQTTSEATYTGYARIALARASGTFAEATGVISNVAAIVFGTCTAGSSTVTNYTLGQASTGTGAINFFGPLVSSLAVSTSANQTPQFAAGAFQISAS